MTVPENHVILLEFLSFAIESHPTCAKDYVEVFDGANDKSHPIGKYCGHTFPQIIESSRNMLTLVFKSNEANIRTGFKAYYRSILGELCRYHSTYKANHSSETALIRVQDDILKAIDSHRVVLLLLLDLSAAFDTVDLSLIHI